MAEAAARAGRSPSDIRLIAVSKTFPVDAVRAAYDAGQRDFGENRVQEALAKIAATADLDIRWHLVGHLQTNKVKDALELFDVIHSLDRIELARELDRRARARGRAVGTLLQVNVGGEERKGGWPPDSVEAALEATTRLGGLEVRGLMTIPPAVERPEEARGFFRALRTLAERHGLPELSMGMSGDFEVAVEEGATMVRVGTAIFGPRPPRELPS